MADVTIPLRPSDEQEVTIYPDSLVFTSSDWSVPQTVTVGGLSDDVDDGDVLLQIVTEAAISDDPKYSGLDADNVEVTNINLDLSDSGGRLRAQR